MKLSTGSKRLFALSVLFLFLFFAVAPVAAVNAGPGDTTEPIPIVPPDGPSSTGPDSGALLALMVVIADVASAVVL